MNWINWDISHSEYSATQVISSQQEHGHEENRVLPKLFSFSWRRSTKKQAHKIRFMCIQHRVYSTQYGKGARNIDHFCLTLLLLVFYNAHCGSQTMLVSSVLTITHTFMPSNHDPGTSFTQLYACVFRAWFEQLIEKMNQASFQLRGLLRTAVFAIWVHAMMKIQMYIHRPWNIRFIKIMSLFNVIPYNVQRPCSHDTSHQGFFAFTETNDLQEGTSTPKLERKSNKTCRRRLIAPRSVNFRTSAREGALFDSSMIACFPPRSKPGLSLYRLTARSWRETG